MPFAFSTRRWCHGTVVPGMDDPSPTVWMCMCPVLYRSEIHQSPKTCTVEPYEHQATNIVWVEEVDIPINQSINTQKISCHAHVLFISIYVCTHFTKMWMFSAFRLYSKGFFGANQLKLQRWVSHNLCLDTFHFALAFPGPSNESWEFSSVQNLKHTFRMKQPRHLQQGT